MYRTYDRVELGGADRLNNRRRRFRVLRPLENVDRDLEQGMAETERLRPLLLGDLFVLVAKLRRALTRETGLERISGRPPNLDRQILPPRAQRSTPDGNSNALPMLAIFGL